MSISKVFGEFRCRKPSPHKQCPWLRNCPKNSVAARAKLPT
jgi:meiotic recombination protein DMC1